MAASPSLFEELHDLHVTRGSAGRGVDDRDRARSQSELVRTHLPVVWRFLRRLGLSPEDADDVAQEVFLVAVRKMDQIEEGRERRYLFGIALRITSRYRRSQRVRADKAAGDDVETCKSPDLDTDELLARKQARVLLDKALSEMSADLRTTFVLYELEEMTMLEISTITEAPMGTVASRLRRAREQFQDAVKQMQRTP